MFGWERCRTKCFRSLGLVLSGLKGAALGRRAFFVAVALLLGASSVTAASGTAGVRVFERATLAEGVSAGTLTLPGVLLSAGSVQVIIETAGISLAQEQTNRRSRGLPELDSAGQRDHVQALRGAQADLKETLESLGGVVTHEYGAAFNGLSAAVPASRLAQVSALPGVTAIHRARTMTRHLDNSVPFILGGKTVQELGVDGAGVTIAIIDTGIDYTHADLGGTGNPADYAGNDPSIVEPGTFPTAKVIGGIDLVGEFYDPECVFPGPPPACNNVPVPDPDPLDLQGHGTHVAGIAAGIGTDNVPPGVAPGARLLAIKVFGLGSTTDADIIAAIEFALDPDRDGDTSDRVDVINMSLGAPFGGPFEPGAVAANAAAELGVVVAASAGNSGDIPFIAGSPASATGAISVAASNDPGMAVQLIEALGSNGVDGRYESIEASFTPPLAQTGLRSGSVQFGGPACDVGGPGGPNPFGEGTLAGAVVLVQRGSCRFDEKVVNASEAGAVAAVVFNNAPGGGPFAMGGDPIAQIPAVMIGNADGLALRDALLPSTTLTLDPANMMPIPDLLQDFTSRGPRFLDSALKPEISAPGGSVLSAAAGSGTGGVSFSGTSMAAPHIAGVAALLRELHPGWTAAAIKALMMNTATDNIRPDGSAYPLELMGAGRVRADVAVDSESVAMPASLSFGMDQVDAAGTAEFRARLTVINDGPADKTFVVSASMLAAPDDGTQVVFDLPATIAVNGGASESLDFRVQLTAVGLAAGASFEGREGFLTLREVTGGGDVLRVPFQIIPRAVRAAAEAADKKAQVELRNDGARGTQVDIYQLGVVDPNEDLIPEPAGQPQQPDDWFDISATGAHAVDTPFGRVVEFAVAVHGARSVANALVAEVFLDVDKDSVPDYVVVAADRGFLTSGVFDGTMVSAIFSLSSGMGLLEFFTANEPNSAWQTAPFLLGDLNFLGFFGGGPTIHAGNPDFDYWVVATDLLTEVTVVAMDSTDRARFNALSPALEAVDSFPFLAPGERLLVDVAGTARAGALLALFYNNDSAGAQSDIIVVDKR